MLFLFLLFVFFLFIGVVLVKLKAKTTKQLIRILKSKIKYIKKLPLRPLDCSLQQLNLPFSWNLEVY